MRVTAAWIVGLGLLANGLTMLANPDAWYGLLPGVVQTGPFNPHFVRDIGAAYLVTGALSCGSRSIAMPGRRRKRAPLSSPCMRSSICGTRWPDGSMSINCLSICPRCFCRRRSQFGSHGLRGLIS